MADFIINNNSATQQILLDESGFIGVDGSLVTNGADAVVGGGLNNLTVLGTLAALGSNKAIHFSGVGSDGNFDLTIGKTGQITSNSAFVIDVQAREFDLLNSGFISGGGIRVDGFRTELRLINNGTILSQSSALVLDSSAGNSFLTNTGEMIGTTRGVSMSAGAGDATLINSGHLSGGSTATSIGFYGSGGNQKIYNTGLISGGDEAIRFVSGRNFYDGTGGQVIGAILGASGSDTIVGGAFGETIHGLASNDVLFGNGGNDILNGGRDRDVVRGGAGADELNGGLGDEDWLDYRGSSARVVVNLGTGQADGGDAAGDFFTGFERIIGSRLNDTLTGDSGNNVIRGDGGADFIRGASGDDLIAGGKGGDILDGGNGNDALDYRASSAAVAVNLVGQKVSGGDAQGDTISNFEGVYGSAFDDRLIASKVANVLWGDKGNDTFHFRSNLGPKNIDTVIDFTADVDTIELEDAIFTAIVQPQGSLLSGYFKANTNGVATDANDRVIYDTDSGELYYDADGNGAGAAVQFAHLNRNPKITFDDFDVV